jgi:hypothetical protein
MGREAAVREVGPETSQVTRLEKALVRLVADLKAGGFGWALVGGFAVTLRSEPRTTRDIDVVLTVAGEPEASAAALHLRLRGYRDHPDGAVIEHKDGRLATVRLISPLVDGRNGAAVDLLIASSGVEREVVAGADLLEVTPGVMIPVAKIGHLLALKVLAGRPKDLIDIQSLLQDIDPGELQLARETLVLIEQRNFHRGKNLLAEFENIIKSLS